MSHEVTDLEPVFEYLSAMNSSATELWEARYICFIWLSLICMIPFDLKKVDSGNQSQVRPFPLFYIKENYTNNSIYRIPWLTRCLTFVKNIYVLRVRNAMVLVF